MWKSILLASILLTSIQGGNSQFFSNLVNSVSNNVQNALGIAKPPSPPGSFLVAEAPVPMYALAPGPASRTASYSDMKALLVNASGPVVYKAAQAMAFLFPDAQTDTSLASRSTVVQLTNNTGSLLAAYVNSTLILAFNSSNDVYRSLLTTSNTSSTEVTFLQPLIAGTKVLNQVLQPVQDLISGNTTTSLDAIISNISANATPARVLLTGFGAGGALAQVAALYTSVTYANTLMRCITFGAPPVMNSKAGFIFQQFVDLPNIWAYNGSALVNTVLRTIDNNTNPTVDGRYTFSDYAQAIVNAGAYAQSNGSRIKTPGIGYEIANSNAAIPSAKGFWSAVPATLKEVSGTAAAPTPVSDFANETLIQTLTSAPAPRSSPSCPPILCKIRAPAEAACGEYEVFPPQAPSFVPILRALNTSQQIATQPYDTHVAIDWSAAQRKAIFVFRGSITNQDWLQDAKLRLTDGSWLLSPQILRIFPGIQTHTGFTQQFQEVTSKAANSSVQIANILAGKMMNVPPEVVVCTGHSLGGALASLCAVWAAIQYPGADVLAVTMGQPYTGNQVYVDAYRMLVGREYRLVQDYDIVPSIPPTDGYRHVGLGIWETQGQVLLADRPPITLNKLNWDDHNCVGYSRKPFYASNVTILSNATAETYLPETKRGG